VGDEARRREEAGSMARRVSMLIVAFWLASSGAPGDGPKGPPRSDGPARDAPRGDAPVKPDAADLPRAEPGEVGIDEAAFERLRRRAEEADSDAVVIVKDGRLVADWDFGRPRGPIEAMSATKSIVCLAIGRLIDQGKIKSLDQPVHEFYPEWKQGRKKLITVRHLLNHTSGLQCPIITPEIYDSPDFVQFALAAEISDDPGSKFFYNNKAVNLLAGVVKRASGQKMNDFIGKEIFEPLGIKEFGWSLDRAGNPHAMAGLQIGGVDLAKIGQLMLDDGAWKGRQIVSKEWVRRSIEPGQSLNPTCGLLWWLVADRPRLAIDDAVVKHFKDRGMTPRSLEKLEALKGKPMPFEAFWAALRPIVREDVVLKAKLRELNNDLPPLKPIVGGPVRGYAAQGYLGQFLFVMPKHRLVAVRQRRYREGTNPEDSKTGFGEFMEMVAALVPDKAGG
jgi:CubicO group peptidase (beta-lactamase class C family)